MMHVFFFSGFSVSTVCSLTRDVNQENDRKHTIRSVLKGWGCASNLAKFLENMKTKNSNFWGTISGKR